MSFAQALSAYLNLNLLILLGFAGLYAMSFALKKLGLEFGARRELRLHYSMLAVVLGFALLHPLLPGNEFLSPAAKVWSAPSIKSFGKDFSASAKSGYFSLSAIAGNSVVKTDQLAMVWAVMGAMLLFMGALFISRDLHLLLKIKRNSFAVRRIGRVQVLINENLHVPFSYWLPGQANIVVPSALIARREDYKMAIAHELQHHRHGDTRWVYVMWGLKLACVVNPAIHLWSRWISEIQEFACDETLVDQEKVESRAYARCLIEVAQTAINQKHVPVCATGLTFLIERNLLKRRIEKMFQKQSSKIGRSISVGAGLAIATVIGATAFASKGLVQDRRVSMGQAQEMALRAQSEMGFPIVVNDLVLKQLNRFVGTPEGRTFVKGALIRMEAYKPVILEAARKYGVPADLLAVPIVESGYRNLTASESSTSMRAAGLWQFIPSTARNYGLRVNERRDERLDVPLSTDAAMRYLLSNYLRFGDWNLSMLAYNMGEGSVQKGIFEHGTRDAWMLIRGGVEGDKDYLARVVAAMLILKNPESVE
jgi:membrane-bound lytic murein transglycosylase D